MPLVARRPGKVILFPGAGEKKKKQKTMDSVNKEEGRNEHWIDN